MWLLQELKPDLYMETTNCAGLSAYNYVERKMFHLSKEMTGVVLPHDTYGSHLDSGGKTIDTDLEMKNFEAAGRTLAKIWSNLTIDGYPTVSEYVTDPPDPSIQEFVASAAFKNRHVFESQYFCAYIKCDDLSCCDPFTTNVDSFFPHRRLPPIIPIKKTRFGIEALEKDEVEGNKDLEFLPLPMRILYGNSIVPKEYRDKFGDIVPYDLYLPSIQDKIEKRVCPKCFKYHATIKSLVEHKKVCEAKKSKSKPKKNPRRIIVESSDSEEEFSGDNIEEDVGNVEEVEEVLDEFDEDQFAQVEDLVDVRPKYSISYPGEFVEQIVNLREWLKSPWVLDDNNNVH